MLFFLIISMNFGSSTQTYLIRSNQWEGNLTKIYMSALAWGDIDNNGYLDLIATGVGGINYYISKIYLNNGTTLTENSQWQNNLTAVSYGSLSFGDIDNDGDLDLALSGCKGQAQYVEGCPSTSITKIYINNGTSLVESSQWQSNLTGAYRGSLTFADINNDGDLDLALTGQTDSTYVSKIYINNGTSLMENSQWQGNLTAVRQSGLALGDMDNDGDLDLILSGRDLSSTKRSIAYINNGTAFIESSQWGTNLVNVDDSSVTFADFDNDGDLDLSLAGCCDIHRLYRNNGTAFIEINREDIGTIDGFFAGSATFGDYDTDGYLDLITSGREDGTFLHLYNVSTNNFTDYSKDPESHIVDLHYSSLAWLDLDNDTDLDLIETGYDGLDIRAYIYLSNRSLTKNNTKPSPPNSSFSANYVNNILTLSWGNGSDAETNTSGLYYNLMAGNSTKNNSIVSGVYGGSSNPTAGYFGNMMQRKSISLNVQLEANKTYYWYVQTIDTGLAKSNWSSLQNFTTSLDITKPNITINYPSPNVSLHTSNAYFIFNATVTDANLTNVTLNANWTGSWHVNQSNSSGINGTYTFTVNLTNNADGHYAWYIGANDSSNNSQTSGTRNFYLDRAYPLVYLISPANSATWTSSSTVTLSYNVSDVDIANCSLIIDNAIDQTDTTVTTNTAQTFTKTLSNGNYNWNVNCTDYLNRINSSSMYSLTVSVSSGSSSSGGGGGGGGAGGKTYTLTETQFSEGYTQSLAANDKIKFSIENETHEVKVANVTSDKVLINVSSKTIQATLLIKEEKRFDLTNDNYYDLLVKMNNITENKANLTIKSIYEEVPIEKKEEKAIGEAEKIKEEKEKEEINLKYYIIVGIAVIILVLYICYKRSKKWQK